MQKRITKNSDKDKPCWDWSQVQCTLKINEPSKKSVVWNLAPTIILTNPTSEYSDPNVRLYIDTQKSLQYSPELGWNWHKSWNLPNISLRLQVHLKFKQIKDQVTGELLLAPKNLYAQMFAVKKNCENERSQITSLIDVGIRGDGKMEMIDGQVYFSAMKFSSTTYNNQGMNFNLLIVLYINEDGNDKPKILTAVISPGIFVDSRRSARDYQQKKFNSFIEPFLYQNLEKQYIKRENKSKTQSQIVIKNDPEGFYNYLTAPNIRHKVKHPVFLAIKFSNCVQILYNTQILDNVNTKMLIENLQKKLLKQNKSKPKNENGFMGNPNEKTFIFLVENMNDSLKKKKVMESIQTMENSAIGIVYERKDLNGSFLSIGDPESLIKAYRESYQNLLEQCKKYEPSDSQEQSSQEEEQISERSVKKVKLDEYPKTVTRSAGNPAKKPQPNSFDKIVLKKEESDNNLQEPKFFPPTLNQIGSKKGSAFNRAVGFKKLPVQNSDDSDEKNSENNGKYMKKPDPVRMVHSMSQQDQNISLSSQQENKGLENLINNNLMLNNWLNSVKNNNVNLYDSMTGNILAESLLNPNPMDRFGSRNQQRNSQNPYQINQQLQCLMQQVNLYRELLAQITYQNALLGGRYPSNQNNTNQSPNGMNYPPEMLHNMLSSMSSLNPLGGGLGLPQLHGLGGLGGLGGIGGLNLNGLGGNLNLPNIGGQGISAGNIGGQGFPPQGMGLGSGLSGLIPNLQNMQALQALQSLGNFSVMKGGLMGPGSFGGLGSQQMSSNLNLNEILRGQYEHMKEQEKRGREDGNK